MTNPAKQLAMMFVESKTGNGGVNSLEKSTMKAEGGMPACQSVQLINVGHLTAPTYRNRINDDGGLFAAGYSGRAGDAALLIVTMEMRDMDPMKIYISEPFNYG